MSEPKSSSDRRPLEGRAAAGLQQAQQIRIIIIRHCIICILAITLYVHLPGHHMILGQSNNLEFWV